MTVVLEITDFTVEPAEFVAVTARRSFLPDKVDGTTKLWLSKPAIALQVVGTGWVAEIVVALGQLYQR